jgi:hypothetical protein
VKLILTPPSGSALILALSAEAVNLGAAPRDNHRRKLHGVAEIETAVAFVSVCFGISRWDL